jgi:hypothetical protein
MRPIIREAFQVASELLKWLKDLQMLRVILMSIELADRLKEPSKQIPAALRGSRYFFDRS